MKKEKARHLGHGVFAFFILVSFFGAVFFLENQGSLITGFAVSEVSADSSVTATLGIGIPTTFRWQGQEYTLKASTISLGEGKVKMEVSKGSVSSAIAKPTATTTTTRSPTTATTSTRTTTATPTTTTRSSSTTTISPTRTSTTTPITATRTASTTILAKCQDKIDNDKDGKIDYPADRGCTSLADSDETDAVATATTSTRTTTTTPTTTTTRSTTTTTASGSTVTGRATVSTTTTRSPITTATSPTTTSTTAARSTSTATTSTSGAASTPLKKLGDIEILKAEEINFDLDGDGTDDVTFTLLEVPSSRQASVEIKIAEQAVGGVTPEPLEGEVPTEEPGTELTTAIEGNLIYSNDLIDVNEILDDAGKPTASYEVTYHLNEIGKRIPFSFPCKPEGVTSIEDDGALGGIKDKIKAVYSYDANEKWLIWNPDTGAPSNIQDYFSDYFPDDQESAQFFFGYYLILKEEAELTITCSDFGAEKFEMIPGWNVFGIHGMEEKEAGEFLKEGAEISEINEFKDGKIQKLSDKKKTKLQPGKVYWANLKKGIDLQNPAGAPKEEEP